MATVDSTRESRSLLQFVARELAPRDGRGAAVARISVGCAITVAIAMLFRIPLPSYMAYIVFTISKDEQSSTFKAAIGGSFAVLIAVIASLLLFSVDTAEPALRLPAMAFMTFVAMYTSRTFALGPISFLAGFVLVLVQSLVDDIPKVETLVRTTLWLWVVVLVPVCVSVLTNLLAGQSAAVLIKRTTLRVLLAVESALLHPTGQFAFADQRAEMLVILGICQQRPRALKVRDAVGELMIRRLLDALTVLGAFGHDLPMTARSQLAQRVRASRLAIQQPSIADDEGKTPRSDTFVNSPTWVALDATLRELRDSIGRHPPEAPPAAKTARRLFVADAFSNPEYVRFAFKSTLAVMLVYSIYTLLNYPGMRTSIVTCFWVALGTLGETVHKLTLRITGAILGGITAALCIVFVLPSLTDIGQLSLLIAAVAAVFAWVATSSERLSYAGMQMAFAFYLGVLQGYVPATDLTVLRDRVAGILLGNIVITLIFSLLWPESVSKRLRTALADLFRSIAALLRSHGDELDALRLRTATALVSIDNYRVLQEFESKILIPGDLPGHLRVDVPAVERLAATALVASNAAILPYAQPALMAVCAQWADEAAGCVLTSNALPNAPIIERSTDATQVEATVAQRADLQLQREIETVVGASP